MKLEPIVNPHAKAGGGLGGTQKKTKQEEKDELIEKTKKTTIDKYGVSRWMIKRFLCNVLDCELIFKYTITVYRRRQLGRNTCRTPQI